MANANVKISQLPVTTTMTNSSILPIVVSGTTYQISGTNMKSFMTNGLGNISSLNLDGNSANVLYGNGTWSSASTANLGNLAIDNYNIYNTTGQGVIISNFNFVTEEAETAYVQIPAGNSSNDLNVVQEQGNVRLVANSAVWNFDTSGNLTLPGNTFSVNYANGTQVQIGGGGGNANALVNGGNSFVLDSDGSVVFEGADPGEGINRGLVWDYGTVANGVNSEVRQDNSGITVRAWTENSGGANGYSAPVRIVTNQDAAENVWLFDGQGNLTVPTGNINAINDGGQLGAQVALQPDLGLARLAARAAQSVQNFASDSWSNAEYTGTQINIVDAAGLLGFVSNNSSFNASVDRTMSINGGEPVLYQGYGSGGGNNVTLYTDIAADPDPTTVTSIDFYYQLQSYIGVDYDDGGVDIIGAGLTINIDNDQTQGPDINLRSGDDITLQAKDKSLGSESEGGDINIYAGDGASDDGTGNTSSTGGDIQIVAGNGGDGNTSSGSTGGFATLRGGQGGIAGASDNAGSGGYVAISGGAGGSDNGNAQLGAAGGYVSITAGASTQEGVNGADVTINSGGGGPNALAGNVEIFTPVSANGLGGTWRFDGQGNLTLPDGIPYIKTSDETSTINIRVSGAANNRSQFQIGSDGGTDQYTYISSQNDTNGFASFGLNAYSGVPTSAVIGINNGTALDWTFTSAPLDSTEAYLYAPAGTTITTPNAPSGENGKNIFVEAGSVDQENYNTNRGGELFIKGGRGGFNDGGGGGPGGNVNINAGESADPAGHAGNVYVTAGPLKNWTFDYTGNLTLPGNLILPSGASIRGDGASPAPSLSSFSSVSAASLTGELTTAAQPNVTSVGTLTSLNVNGTLTAVNITANTGVFSGNGANLTNIQHTNVTGLGNIATVNLNGNASQVLYGNGVFSAISISGGTAINNGNSNVNIASANGNVTIAVAGSNVITVSSSGANITGRIARTGPVSSTAWGTSGIGIVSPSTTYTDTSSAAGTQGFNYVHTLYGGTLAYSNAVTVTTAAGLLVTAPSAGANTTITNTYSIVAAGNAWINGSLLVGNVTGNTNGFALGYLNVPQVPASSNTTLALSDAGKHYYSTTAGNVTLTIPLNSSVAFANGATISIVVQAAGNVLVNAASGVNLYMAGNSTAANRVVGSYGMATLMKVATDTWFINGTGVS